MKTKIIGTGHYLPEKVVTNDDLAQIMDTSDEWIRKRTGIATRHISVDESTTDLSIKASLNAIENAGVDPKDIDLIIVATVSGDYLYPNTACQVQKAIGAEKARTIEINIGCAGCIYSMDIADSYIRSGKSKLALVMGAETLSKMMDWTDRRTAVLFGDGAGAFILKAVDDNEEGGIEAIMARGDGERGDTLTAGGRPLDNPWGHLDSPAGKYTYMDGQEVFKFACRKVPESIHEILDPLGVKPDDIDKYFLHQANIRILETVAKFLKQPMEKFPVNMSEVGNISAASIPTIMDMYNKKGLLKKGEKYILCGFGAGLTYATAYVIW
ncbi:MAG: ketoacyl-ACP synthase III [Lachnospiraceae bacterium]|nr:ketoacyl-ACP synthase III [Lachnospiraceae bacterium]